MDFNNQQIRLRVIEHINFAVKSVASAMPLTESDYGTGEEGKIAYQMALQLRNPIVMQLLAYTLNLDYELKNTLVGQAQMIEGDKNA